jgi:hypothetical protein
MAQTAGSTQSTETFGWGPSSNTYTFDREDRSIAYEILQNYLDGTRVQDTSLRALNDTTIKKKVQEWKDLWNGVMPDGGPQNVSPEDMSIFYKFVRTMVKKYLANFSQADLETRVKAQENSGFEDRDLADAMKTMNEYENERAEQDQKLILIAIEAAVAGTCFAKETFIKEAREVDVATKYNPETGETESEKQEQITYMGCKTELRRIENVLFPNLYTDNIQDQEWVIDQEVMHKGTFESKFGRFPNFEQVQPGVYSFPGRMYHEWDREYDHNFRLKDEQVHVIEWYRKWDNRLVILANGIDLYDGPNPYEHGQYPHIRYIHEPFEGHPLMYGNSFVSNIEGEQKMYNVMFNALSRKAMYAAYPQLLTENEEDYLEDERMDIGEVRQVQDLAGVRVEQFPGIDNGDMGMLGEIQKLVQQNSGNIQGGGELFSPEGGKVSVRQALMAQESALKQVGFNVQWIEYGEKRRMELRIANLRQFYTIPEMTMISGAAPEDARTLKVIRQNNMPLSDGNRGTKYLHLYKEHGIDEAEDLEIQRQLDIAEEIADQQGEEMEAMAVSDEFLRRFDYHVQVVRGTSYAKNKSVEMSERMELAKFILTVNPKISREEVIEFVMEVTGHDISRFLSSENASGMMQEAQAAQAQAGGAGAAPRPQGGGGAQGNPQAEQQIQKLIGQGQTPPRQEKSANEAGKVMEETIVQE